MTRYLNFILIMVLLFLFGATATSQGHKYCILVKQKFTPWCDCGNYKYPSFYGAELLLSDSTTSEAVLDTIYIMGNESVNKDFFHFEKSFSWTLDTTNALQMEGFGSIKVRVAVSNIANDNTVEYKVSKDSYEWHQGSNNPEGKSASDPCSNDFNWSSNREGYSTSTEVYIEGPVKIYPPGKQEEGYDCDTEYLKLTFDDFKFFNDNQYAEIQYAFEPNASQNEWNFLQKIDPGKDVYIAYSDIAGKKNAPNSNYYDYLDEIIYFRVKKRLANGDFSYGNMQQAKFTTLGPQFRVLDVKRSFCNPKPNIYVELLNGEDSLTFDKSKFQWVIKKNNVSYNCKGDKEFGTTYKLTPTNVEEAENPFTTAGEWTIQLQYLAGEGFYFDKKTFTIPEKAKKIEVKQSDATFPLNSTSPVYHLLSEENPYAVINIDDDEARVPYSVKKIEDSDTVFVDSLFHVPTGFNDLPDTTQNNIQESFNDSIAKEKGQPNSNWGKYFKRRFNNWFFEKMKPEETDLNLETSISGCESEIGTFLFALSENSRYLVYGYVPLIVDNGDFNLFSFEDGNISISSYHDFWKTHAKSGFSGGKRYYTFDGDYTHSGTTFDGFGLSIRNGVCYTNFPDSSKTIQSTSHKGTFKIQEYNGCSIIGEDNDGDHYLIGTLGNQLAYQEIDLLEYYDRGILDKTGTRCAYTNRTNSAVYYYERGMNNAQPFPANMVDNIRYISSGEPIDFIIYEKENGVRMLQYIVGDFNKDEIFDRIFNDENHDLNDEWFDDYLKEQWKIYLTQNYGYRLYGVTANPDEPEPYILTDVDGCDYPFEIEVKIPPQPEFNKVDSLAPSTLCSSDGQRTISCNTAELLPLTCGDVTLNTTSDVITVSGLAWTNTIEFDNESLGLTYSYSGSFTDPARGIQGVEPYNNTCGEKANGMIETTFASNSTSKKTYRLHNEKGEPVDSSITVNNSHTFDGLKGNKVYYVSVSSDGCTIDWSKGLQIENEIFTINTVPTDASAIGDDGSALITVDNIPDNLEWTGIDYLEGSTNKPFAVGSHTITATHGGCTTLSSFEIHEPGFTANANIVKKNDSILISFSNYLPNDYVFNGNLTIEDADGNIYDEDTKIPADNDYSIVFNYNGNSSIIYSLSENTFSNLSTAHSVATTPPECPGDEVEVTIDPQGDNLSANFEGIFTNTLSFLTKENSLAYAVRTIQNTSSIVSAATRLNIHLALEKDNVIPVPQATEVSGTFKYTDSSCNGSDDGRIEMVDFSGGSGHYQWRVGANETWLNSNEADSDLTVGKYNVFLKDSLYNCEEVKLGTVTISEPDFIRIDTLYVNQPTCEQDNGTISTKISGGNTLYKYEWKLANNIISYSDSCTQDSIYAFDNMINGGQYQLIITDTLGCQRTRDFDLKNYSNPSISNAIQDSVRCYNEQNGEITIQDFDESSYGVDSNFLFNQENEMMAFINNDGVSELIFSQLAAGRYKITVKDSLGCVSNDSSFVDVEQPDSLYLTTKSIHPVIDKGSSTGIIEGSVFNGNDGVKYIDLLSNTSGIIIDSLRATDKRDFSFKKTPAGTYRMEVSDIKGCSFLSDTMVITEPENSLGFEVINRNDALCKAMTGSFEIQGTGGWGDYEYKRIIENEQFDDIVGFTSQKLYDGLAAGSYIVTVRDSLGATFRDTVIIISPNEFLHASVEDIVLPSCGDNGSFKVDVDGGTAPYKLAFMGKNDTIRTNGLEPIEYNNRPDGAYIITITDNMGCHFTLETELTNDSILTIETPLQAGYPTAPENSDGWLKAIVSGGHHPLTFQWYNAETGEPLAGATKYELTQIPAGFYEIVVSDTENCSQSERHYLPDINEELLQIIEKRNETSWQGNNGFVKLLSPLSSIKSIEITLPDRSKITATPGNLPENCVISEDTLALDNLSPGTYLVTALHTETEKASVQFEIEDYKPMVFSNIQITHAETPGDASGRIEADINGGILPYNYQWVEITGQLQNASINHSDYKTTADNLISGTYRLTVTDKYNNQIETEPTVSEPESPLTLKIVDRENVRCKNFDDGFVILSPSGGWGEYQFRHNEGIAFLNKSSWNDLPPSEHTFFLVDKTGTLEQVSVTITEPDTLESSVHRIDSVKCFGNSNGAITFNITGGTAPYRFARDNAQPIWATDTIADNLSAGEYTYVFTDKNTCPGYDTLTITVPEPDPLQFSLTNVTHTTCNTDNGAIDVALEGGTQPYRYEWLNSQGENIGTSSSVSNLAQNGFYELNVLDINNCSQHFTQEINPSTNPSITGVETTPVLCYGDSNGKAIVAGINAAEPYAPYSIEWSNSQSGEIANGYEAGRHFVTVRDTNKCEATRYFDITTPDPLGLNILKLRNAHCYGYSDGLIQLEAKGGVGQYEFTWSNGDSTTTASNLAKGSYSVLVSDSNNCVFEQGFVIDEPPMETVDVGEDILMCPGNAITIDGKDFAAHLWTIDEDTLSNERYFTVDKAGAFFLKATNNRGCFAYDTINVEIGNNALQADFLMTSEAFLSDTLEIFEISNLPLDSMIWEYEQEVFSDQTPAIADDYVLHLKTTQTGMYNVILYAYSGGCFSNISKQVEILEGEGLQGENDLLGYQEPLIKSFIVSPNPNPGNFSVDVELRETTDIHLAIFSVTEGIKIDDKSNTGLDEYHERFTLNGINTGVYVVVLTVEGERRQVKIVIE